MTDWVFLGVTWTFGTILLVISLTITIRRLAFKRQAVKGYARIVGFRCNPSEFGKRFYPVFEIDIDGEPHTQESEYGFNPPAGQVGETIGILYNPNNLAQSMIPEFTHLWGTGLYIGSIGVAMFLAGVFL